MTILAIETATAVCAAAVVRNGAVLGEAHVESPHVHSERLISLIDQALGHSGLGPGQLDGIAVSLGPGSFTGLRIGLSVAKGLAYASGKPLIAVLTLKGLAMQAVRQSLAVPGSVILPLIDARRAEVYAAAYRFVNGVLEELIPSRTAHVHEIFSLLGGETAVVIMGDGAEKFQEFGMESNIPELSRFVIPHRESRLCSAAAVGLLGERELAAGHTADLAALEPLYVQEFQTLIRTRRQEVEP